eukprot:12094671-Karenia_brevis.AAC.1
MPHCRSVHSKIQRTARAIALGYVTDSTGGALIQVDKGVAQRAKTVAHSLAVHRQHNLLAEKASHHGIAAALKVRNQISADSFRRAVHVHQRANLAKHSWSSSREIWPRLSAKSGSK